ncbi:MAG: glyoxylase-like metal-dependent hydrolase (beta-lactamase superfamily II) [Parasphingorhabdus sp.]|jgi:glyoxylase-like metal-dependent hydrolase (beta-lactamase superfamily II)
MKKLPILFGLLLFLGAFQANAQSEPKRSITQLGGDLYRFQNNFHFSVFLVTEDGVLVTDPINADAATWLSNEIESRFGKPIKYLVYSHHHADHISGGEVFKARGATVISHENAVWGIESDSVVTAMPDITFSDNMTLSLGGKSIQLKYLGRNHSDNSIVVLFPDEKILFAVDFINVNRLPYRNITRSFFPDYFDSYAQLATLDFTLVAPGHGPTGSKQEALDHGTYLKTLHDLVVEGKQAGKSAQELKTEITLDAYKSWGRYDDWLPLNIEGMYQNVD